MLETLASLLEKRFGTLFTRVPRPMNTAVQSALEAELFNITEQHLPCLAHSVNLGVIAFVDTVTQTALLESQESVWSYDPATPGNLRDGNLDGIAIIRTLVVKIQASSQRVEFFEKCQSLDGTKSSKIPLHSKTRWGTAALMCAKAYEKRDAIDTFLDKADHMFGPITTIKKGRKIVKKIDWLSFKLGPNGWARLKDCADILQVR